MNTAAHRHFLFQNQSFSPVVLMSALSIDHYNLRAERVMMARLRDFYCEFLGLQLGPRPPLNSFGYWLYAGEQAVLHISESRPGETRAAGRATTFDHVAFRCQHYDTMLARLRQSGISCRCSEPPALPGQPAQRQIFFQDPAGNGIELNFSD